MIGSDDVDKITVLQVLPALESGGVERGTLEVAGELVRRGHRSIVISGGGGLTEALTSAGSEHITWPIGKKSFWTLRLVPRLRRLLLQEGVDILHARSRLPAWVAYLAWRGMDPARRPRFVTTVHGFYTVGRYSAVMTRGERVIAVSDSVRSYVADHYPQVDPARVRVIHRGVDREEYPFGYVPGREWLADWRREYPQLADRYVVTLPARLTRWKGQQDFIRIIEALVARGLPVHGLMVGGHHPRKRAFVSQLHEAIERHNLGDRITMTGQRSDLREILAVSSAVLSLSWYPEAFGRTTIEALSLGRPVCGYDHGGVAEQLAAVLPQGRVPVGDWVAVVDRLAEWYRAPPKVPAEHPFTLNGMLDRTLQLYEQLVAERATDARVGTI